MTASNPFYKTAMGNTQKSKKNKKFKILRINGKKLFPVNSVKYLGIKTEEQLHWEIMYSEVAIKNRAKAMLQKVKQHIQGIT